MYEAVGGQAAAVTVTPTQGRGWSCSYSATACHPPLAATSALPYLQSPLFVPPPLALGLLSPYNLFTPSPQILPPAASATLPALQLITFALAPTPLKPGAQSKRAPAPAQSSSSPSGGTAAPAEVLQLQPWLQGPARAATTTTRLGWGQSINMLHTTS